MTKLKELLGFSDSPAKWWAWGVIISVVVVGITVFFLSFSLARHKRMIAELRVKVLELNTRLENEKRRLEIERLERENRILGKDEFKNRVKRKEVQKKLEKARQSMKKGEEELKKQQQALKGKSLKDLLKQSKKLTKETF